MRCLSFLLVVLTGCASSQPLHLDQVVLHRNGIGYFEHSGHIEGDRLRLRFRAHEIDDVLKTLAIIDRDGTRQPITVHLPQALSSAQSSQNVVELEVTLGGPRHRDLLISYAVPTPAWKATYRLVLARPGTEAGRAGAVLQGWAMIDNVSGKDWSNVALRLDTGTPLSFATDLRTPRFVARPDTSGHLVQPLATGLVGADRAMAGAAVGQPGDRDGDGIPDEKDLCPDQPEDKDGFQDTDGCPDPDNDGDRIPDAKDQCPNEPETYNGYEDEDGCPDKGRVVVHKASIEILDKIYFGTNTDQIKEVSRPILDATAATLKGNPQITLVEVQGHASENENVAWGLAARRAAAVRNYLIQGGVAAATLRIGVYGSSRPVDSGHNEAARAKNRRVEFVILARKDDGGSTAATSSMTPGVVAAARPGPKRTADASPVAAVRYEIPGRIGIAQSSSALVAIVNQNVFGEEILLYRPEANVPSSDRHPFRAARFRNDTGRGLVAGPMTIFARGTFAGEGFLRRLNARESAFVPYALDTATAVETEHDSAQQPLRLVSLLDGVLTLEDQNVRVTRYRISPGIDASTRIYVKHPRTAGFSIAGGDLPPGTETVADAYLMPIPLNPGKPSVVTVREQQPVRRTVRILDESEAGRLEAYLEGSSLAGEKSGKLRALLALRRRLATEERSAQELRRNLEDMGQQNAEVRASLQTLAKTGGGGELKQKLLGRLKTSLEQTDRLARDLGKANASQVELRARVREAVQQLHIGEP